MSAREAIEGIAGQLDVLAAAALLGGDPEDSGGDTAAALAAIAASAAAAGLPQVEQAARSAVDQWNADGPGAAYAASLARLQQQVEAAASAGDTTGNSALVDDPELLADFVTESREHLDAVEACLLSAEKENPGPEAVHSIFRSFHTIKGLAGFLEIGPVREVAHQVETLLDEVRHDRLPMSAAVVDVVLAAVDYVAGCLRALDGGGAAAVATLADPGELLEAVRRAAAAESNDAAEAPAKSDAAPVAAAAGPAAAARSSRSRSVKIDTAKLDFLVDMVGEMVIAQSLIRYDPDLRLDVQPRLARNLAQLERITSEVQRTTMAMRMVPIGGLFQKMARLTRDLARKFDKTVNFASVGDEVEIDRNIVEELADPLMHMVRNAIDHGVDTAAERRRAGKPEMASVTLTAHHQGGQIVIEIRDDGRGLDRDRILARARAQGLVSPGADPADSEIFNYIFQPGFSTAEQVSDVSGRGVGMDVVRRQIQRLRGSIEIASQRGAGTTFTLRLPLTLAIIDGLVVALGVHRYVVPIFTVRELLRPAADAVFTVENRTEMILIREKLVPVVRLHERFGLEPRTRDVTESVFVLADSADGRPFCLMVDEVLGKQEVVIKSLGPMFMGVPGVAGGAILGDGQVALILDPSALFAGAGTTQS